MKSASVVVLVTLCAGLALAAAQIMPPDKVDFNYPPPPLEGQPNYFAIAEGGQAKCCLVMPPSPKPEESAAVRALQTYLGLATGAKFSIVTEDRIPPGVGQIHFCGSKVALATPLDLPPVRYGKSRLVGMLDESAIEMPNVNGYLIKTVSPEVLVIRGATPAATLLGAVSLLRRYVGVRRYWPGEPGGIGDVVPKNPDLKLPQIEWRDWPYFISRIMSGLDDRGPQSELTRKVTFASFWRMNYTVPSNESYYRLMKAAEHANEPELFPLINGKRFVPTKPKDQGWQPCVSNPRVAQIMANSIKEFFRQNPDKFALNLAVNDGYGDCTCDKCRAMDAPDADPINRVGLCDRYVKFDNQVAERVAKEFPDKILAFIAYGSMRLPPTTAKLHPMLTPVLCVGGNTFQMWDDWQKMGAKHSGAYFYHDDVWFIIPKMDIHQSAKRIRYMVASGVARHFYQEFYGIYPLDGMVGYIEQELTWDPRLKEDDLLAEYYGKFYGKASAPMKAFYDALEGGYQAWVEAVGEPHPFGRDAGSITDSKSLKQFSVLPVEAAATAQRSLDAALAASQGDALVRERVNLVKSPFDFAALGSRLYWAGERLRGAVIADAASADKVLADAREAVHSGLGLADYKFQVMEQPAIKAYSDHGDRDTFYNDLQKGDVHSEVVSAMAASFDRVSAYLGKALSPAKAEAWWQERRQPDDPPLLRRLIDVAAFDASGHKLDNLVKDPSFEERGQKQAASSEANKDGHLTHGGVNVWSSAGTPMRCALTTEGAHTGKHSFVFWQTQRAGVSESVTVKEGDRLRMSVWVKHNDKKGNYVVQTDPRGERGHLPRSTISVPWKPGEWQKFEIFCMPQPGTKTINLWVFVQQQSPGARVWVDDFFIAKYPD